MACGNYLKVLDIHIASRITTRHDYFHPSHVRGCRIRAVS